MAQRIIDRTYVGDVLQHIYTSDLNIKITLFSEGGYFYIGNEERKSPCRAQLLKRQLLTWHSDLLKSFPARRLPPGGVRILGETI
jgi:hypothetical protein